MSRTLTFLVSMTVPATVTDDAVAEALQKTLQRELEGYLLDTVRDLDVQCERGGVSQEDEDARARAAQRG